MTIWYVYHMASSVLILSALLVVWLFGLLLEHSLICLIHVLSPCFKHMNMRYHSSFLSLLCLHLPSSPSAGDMTSSNWHGNISPSSCLSYIVWLPYAILLWPLLLCMSPSSCCTPTYISHLFFGSSMALWSRTRQKQADIAGGGRLCRRKHDGRLGRREKGRKKEGKRRKEGRNGRQPPWHLSVSHLSHPPLSAPAISLLPSSSLMGCCDRLAYLYVLYLMEAETPALCLQQPCICILLL